VIKARIFIASMTAVVACIVILYATFLDGRALTLATAMVPLLTALCTGLLTTEYLERRSAMQKEERANEQSG
jgi:CHASE2 domain-containing sensor protein